MKNDTPNERAFGPKRMYFHQRNTGERAKTFVGTYLVTNFSYEGEIANRMRYDHFERCFFVVVRRLKRLDWKSIFACAKPKEIIAAENELNDALREDDSLVNTTIPKYEKARANPKCSEDSLVEFTNQITAALRRRKELNPKIEALRTALKSEEDKFQPYHNIDEQIEMLQNNPQAEDLRLRAKADIMKIVTRIGLVFGFDPDKGKNVTATISFTDGLVRMINFYPQRYYAEIYHEKGKPEIVRFDHGHHPPYKLTEADAREVYRLYDHGNGMCQKEIAPMMGVTRGVIYNILIGKQYPHLYKELNGSPPINIGNRGKHKLGENKAREIWGMHLEGMTQPEICKVIGVSGVTLSNVLTGKRFHDLYLENKLKPRKNRFLNGKSERSYRCRGWDS